MKMSTTKYELLNELEKGSYGAVYKARDLKTSELITIKVISLSQGEEGYEEICGEIEMLQQCSHPNVLPLIGDGILDLVVIGCGPASLALAVESAKLGLKVGLIGPDLPFTNNYGVWDDELLRSFGLPENAFHHLSFPGQRPEQSELQKLKSLEKHLKQCSWAIGRVC